MSNHQYEPLSTGEGSYPPSSSESHDAQMHANPPYPLRRPHRTIFTILKYAIGASAAFLVIHHASTTAFPESRYSQTFRPTASAPAEQVLTPGGSAHESLLQHLDLDRVGRPGIFFRDPYPIRTMLAFWDLAEEEIKARGLDTCNGQISREFIDAYHQTHFDYCVPDEQQHYEVSGAGPNADNTTFTSITCAAVHRSDFTNWWPYPAAPCVSSNLRTARGDFPFARYGCKVTKDGQSLNAEMNKERFIGTQMEETTEGDCKSVVDHTVVIIGRQDQWNPFHVDEDLVTTLVAIFVAVQAAPTLADTRVQLVFNDGYMIEGNHFTPLWDRVGAWAPRRLSLDAWDDGLCLTNAIHSIGAGASLLSAMGVGSSHSCASSITWAASHYYRHLFGFLPDGNPKPRPMPIHVLWITRSKLDAYAQAHNDWSPWRDARHFDNEPQLIARFQKGLAEFCTTHECSFQHGDTAAENWGSNEYHDNKVPIRFASIDPTVHTLESQLHYVGHTTILVGAHGGALGLSLFLPPGQATIIELQTHGVAGNYHFHNLAFQLGHEYVKESVEKWLDVDAVWNTLQSNLERIWQ